MLDTMLEQEKCLSDIEWPFLVLHGEPDQLTSARGSKLLYERAKSKDKQMKVKLGNVPQNLFIVNIHKFVASRIRSSH